MQHPLACPEHHLQFRVLVKCLCASTTIGRTSLAVACMPALFLTTEIAHSCLQHVFPVTPHVMHNLPVSEHRLLQQYHCIVGTYSTI